MPEEVVVPARRERAASALVGKRLGAVRCDVRQVQEQRLLGVDVLAHKAHGAFVQHVGDVVVVRGAVVEPLTVDREVIAVVAVEVQRYDPARPPGRRRRGVGNGVLVAVQPAADLRGEVAGLLQPDREDVLGSDHALVAGLVREHSVVVPVLAGEEGRPRGTADGRGSDEVLEHGPPVGEKVEGARHDLPPQPDADTVLGHQLLVVSHHDDDVRRLQLAGLARALARRSGGAGEQRHRQHRHEQGRGDCKRSTARLCCSRRQQNTCSRSVKITATAAPHRY